MFFFSFFSLNTYKVHGVMWFVLHLNDHVLQQGLEDETRLVICQFFSHHRRDERGDFFRHHFSCSDQWETKTRIRRKKILYVSLWIMKICYMSFINLPPYHRGGSRKGCRWLCPVYRALWWRARQGTLAPEWQRWGTAPQHSCPSGPAATKEKAGSPRSESGQENIAAI